MKSSVFVVGVIRSRRMVYERIAPDPVRGDVSTSADGPRGVRPCAAGARGWECAA